MFETTDHPARGPAGRSRVDTGMLRLIDAFAGLHVVVIGEAMLDSYLAGPVDRLCREAPVPIVTVEHCETAPGGAANTAVNVRGLGSRVTFLSVIGDDADGAAVRSALEARGIATGHLLVHPDRRTLAKRRIIGASQMLLRFDEGSEEPIDAETEGALIERLASLYPRCDALIASDYGYGILTERVIRAMAGLQARAPRLLVVDSKYLAAYRDVGVTAVKPNYKEAIQLIGDEAIDAPRPLCGLGPGNGTPAHHRPEQIAAYGERILQIAGAEIAAVTIDTDGALIFERNSPPYRTYAEPRPHAHAAGAGDTFVSAFTLALAAGAHTPAAAEMASAAATVVVNKNGTTSCSADELRGYVSAVDKYVPDPYLLAARVEFYRQNGRRIVFTNGCFDILHRGHITYLNRAKELGDVLIVGVNSDESTQQLKGPGRPINPLEDRVQVLAALSCIDHIIPFSEDMPTHLIRIVRPDIFVKGGDYTRETLPEAPLVEDLGGRVEILPYVDSFSTTSIVERIRRSHSGPPAAEPAVLARGKGARGQGDG